MSNLSVRTESPQDEAFLVELYASTQGAAGMPGGPGEKRKLFPDAEFQIVLIDGEAAGRFVVNRTREDLRVVDLALLPRYRNAGFGAAVLRRIFGESRATGKRLRAEVPAGSRAVHFSQRVGFVTRAEAGGCHHMEWRAPAVPVKEPLLPDALKIPFQFDVPRMQAELAGIQTGEFIRHFNTGYYQGDWSGVPLRSVGGRPDHIYPDPTAKNAFADTPLLARCPYIRDLLDSFRCSQRAVRFLRLKAGSVVKEHRDYDLGFEDGEVRLHVPVITNPQVEFVLNQVRVVMNEGECWYLDVNKPHRVANHGNADRIHLVIDCEVNDWLRDLLLGTAAAKKPPVR
jgi:GNAT superfamily N-acetyltransferase